MATQPTYLPNGDIRRYHDNKSRAAAKGESPKVMEQKRISKLVKKMRNRK